MIFSARSLVISLVLVVGLCVASPLAVADDTLEGSAPVATPADTAVAPAGDPSGYDGLADADEQGLGDIGGSDAPAAPSALTVGQNKFNQWLHATRNSENALGWWWHHDILGGALLDPRNNVLSTREILFQFNSDLPGLKNVFTQSVRGREGRLDQLQAEQRAELQSYDALATAGKDKLATLKTLGYNPESDSFTINDRSDRSGEVISDVSKLSHQLDVKRHQYALLQGRDSRDRRLPGMEASIKEYEQKLAPYLEATSVGFGRVFLNPEQYDKLCGSDPTGCKDGGVKVEVDAAYGYTAPPLFVMDRAQEMRKGVQQNQLVTLSLLPGQLADSASSDAEIYKQGLSGLDTLIHQVPGAWYLRFGLQEAEDALKREQYSADSEVKRWQDYQQKMNTLSARPQ